MNAAKMLNADVGLSIVGLIFIWLCGDHAVAQQMEELPVVMARDVRVTEADSIEFVSILAEPASQEIAFDYVAESGSARAGVDFEATSGSLRFEPGETWNSVCESVIQDGFQEEDETL